MDFFNGRYFKYMLGMIMLLVVIILLKQINFAIDPVYKAFRIFITPILFAWIFYYIFRPLYRKLLGVKKLSNSVAIFLVVMLVVVLFSGVVFFTVSTVFRESVRAYSDFSGWMGTKSFQPIDPSEFSLPFFDSEQFNQTLLDLQEQFYIVVKDFTSNILGILGSAASLGYQIILIPFFLVYFLRDDRKMAKTLIRLFPSRYEERLHAYLVEADHSVSRYITGQMMVAVVVGLLMFIGYSIIGMPTKIFLSIFAMITSIIPFLGPFLGIIPALFIALTIDIWLVVKVLLVMLAAQQIEGNFITPNIMSARLPIHPLTVIIIVIGITSLFGLLGGLIAVPSYILLKLLITSVFNYKERIDGKDYKQSKPS